MTTRVTLGTRGSPLALWQTEQVAGFLRAAWPSLAVETRLYSTSGDEQADVPITALQADAFTDRIEHALLSGEIDAAVHSYKDLPYDDVAGLVIAAVPVRADVREALVSRDGRTLAELPPGAVVGTSSVRRGAALRALRPDIELRPIRGPVDARLEKVLRGDYDAAVFAAAGLARLGLERHISEYIDESVIPPAAGQGALAVQCRAGDEPVIAIVSAIDDPALHAAVRTEREQERRAVVA